MKDYSYQQIIELIVTIIVLIACLTAFIIWYVNKEERERDEYYHDSFKNKNNED